METERPGQALVEEAVERAARKRVRPLAHSCQRESLAEDQREPPKAFVTFQVCVLEPCHWGSLFVQKGAYPRRQSADVHSVHE